MYRCVHLSKKCSSQLRKISAKEAALISVYFPAVSNIDRCRICESCRFKLKKAVNINDNQRSTEMKEMSNEILSDDLHHLTSGELCEEYNEDPTCSSHTKSLERNELVDNINEHVIYYSSWKPFITNEAKIFRKGYILQKKHCKLWKVFQIHLEVLHCQLYQKN